MVMVWPVVRSVLPVFPFHWGARTRIRNAAGRQPSVDYVSGATRPAVRIQLTKREAAGRGRDAAGGGNGGLVGGSAVRITS